MGAVRSRAGEDKKGMDEGHRLDDRLQGVVHMFALRSQEEELRVMLEPAVANVFPITSAAVHAVLRALIATMPKTSQQGISQAYLGIASCPKNMVDI